MSDTPTWAEIEKKAIELSHRVAKLEIERGIRLGNPDNKTLQELTAIAKKSKTYEEYTAKIDMKYPMLKEAKT